MERIRRVKFDGTCPGCGGELSEKSNSDFYKCQDCKCGTVVINDQVDSYFLHLHCNNIYYQAASYFDGRSPKFIIEYENKKDHRWYKILELPFHPDINSHNFESKLKTYLLLL